MNSKIILAKGIRIDRDYVNVLNYTENQMLTLLQSSTHLVASASDYQFIRSDNTISTNFTYEQCLQANYIAFQNPDYSNKWFFAWIDDVHYVGNYNTRISFTIDSWTTWFSDWTAKKCFVKRHHVNDDTIGLNRVPENLAVNDVIEIDVNTDNGLIEYYIVMETDWIFNDNTIGYSDGRNGKQFSGITPYNGLISGHQYIIFDTGTELSNIANVYNYIKRTIDRTNLEGHINDIRNLFVIPKNVIKVANLTKHTAYVTQVADSEKIEFYTLDNTSTIGIPVSGEHYTYTVNKNTSFTGYTPKNNKVFTYPWNYLYVTNNTGSYNIYKYEDFYNQATCTFDISLALTIGVSGKLAPTNYKGQSIDLDNGIALGKYPTFSWTSDAFTNWLTSQAVNISTSIIGGMSPLSNKDMETQMSGDIASYNVGLGIAKGIANTIGSFYSASLKPNIDGGTNTGDVNFTRTRNTFYFRRMMATLENIKIADDYFTRFGYAINRLELPNITGRTYWNYIEIGDTECIGYGAVPSKYMDIINKACRRGITVWHNHANVGDFSLNNTIVTP